MNRWLTPIQIPRRFKKIIVNFSLFNYVNTLTAVGITTMDAMMIAAFLGLDETGVYTTIIFLASALQVPYRSLVRIAISYIPLYWKDKNMTSMSKLYKDTSSIALLFALSAFLIVWVNRIELFSFLPHSFSDGIWVFLFIMIGRIVDMFFSLNGNILSYSKKYRVDILFTGSLLIVVFWLNYILIPNYGIVGASISTGLAFVLFNTARMLYVWSVFKLNPFQKNQFWMLLIGGITVLITHYTPSIFDNAVLSIFQNVLEISVLFVVPVLYFKLELKVNDYLLYLVKKIRK
jgi:O-antigen/teichoic acid export membrane protein